MYVHFQSTNKLKEDDERSFSLIQKPSPLDFILDFSIPSLLTTIPDASRACFSNKFSLWANSLYVTFP